MGAGSVPVLRIPSVSAVLKLLAREELERWNLRRHVVAASRIERVDGESDIAYATRIEREVEAAQGVSRREGIELHRSVTSYLSSRKEPASSQALAVAARLAPYFDGAWTTEHPLRSAALGYNGTPDAWASVDGALVVADIKGKPGADVTSGKRLAYDQQSMQLAAYAVLVAGSLDAQGAPPDVRLVNVFVARDGGDAVRLHPWTAREASRAWRQFRAILAYLYISSEAPVPPGLAAAQAPRLTWADA